MPCVKVGQCAIGSEIELQRRDGNESLREGANVRSTFGDTGGRIAADSVIGFVARVDALIETAVIDAQSLPGEDGAADLIVR